MSEFTRLLVCLAAFSIPLFAQSSAGGGNMQGTVKDPTGAVLQIRVVLAFDGLDVLRQLRLDSGGEHRAAVARALAVPNDDFVAHEIDVLDAKTTALEQAEAGPVKESGHERMRVGAERETGIVIQAVMLLVCWSRSTPRELRTLWPLCL